MAWLRLEEDTFDDPALAGHPWHVQLAWVRMLCTVKTYGVDGILPPAMSSAAFLADLWGAPGLTVRRVRDALNALSGPEIASAEAFSTGSRPLLRDRNGALRVKSWPKYQPDGQVNDRVRNHRARRASNKSADMTASVTVTPPLLKRPCNDATGTGTVTGTCTGTEKHTAPDGATPPKTPRKRRTPDTAHARAMEAYSVSYRATYGIAPAIGSRAGRAVQALLAGIPADRAADLWPAHVNAAIRAYLEDRDPWLVREKHALWLLPDRVDKYLPPPGWQPAPESVPLLAEAAR